MESKASTEALKKEVIPNKKEKRKPKGKPKLSKDNPGRVRNRPPSHLSKEDFLQLRVNILEKEKLKLEISNMMKDIDRNEKTNQILRQRASELKVKEQRLVREHDEFTAGIKHKSGIDLKNKSIDFATREVSDLLDV